MLNSVLLPEPLGPMIETYSPRASETLTPRSAWIVSPPIWYSRVTSIVRTACSLSVAAAGSVGRGVVAAESVIGCEVYPWAKRAARGRVVESLQGDACRAANK